MMKVCALLLVAAAGAVKADDGTDGESGSWSYDLVDDSACPGRLECAEGSCGDNLAACDAIVEASLPALPTPVVVNVTIATYNSTEATAAKESIAAAFAVLAPTPVAGSPLPPPPPVVKIASSVGFPTDITTISEGSPERETFETEFRTAMADSIGGGGAVAADDIFIESISAGSVNVNFYIIAPESVQTEAASLIAAVDTTAITVAGVTATAITSPVVTKTPTVNCVGAWSGCDADCEDQVYTVTTRAAGDIMGEACAAAPYATAACVAGDGDCPAVVAVDLAVKTSSAVAATVAAAMTVASVAVLL